TINNAMPGGKLLEMRPGSPSSDGAWSAVSRPSSRLPMCSVDVTSSGGYSSSGRVVNRLTDAIRASPAIRPGKPVGRSLVNYRPGERSHAGNFGSTGRARAHESGYGYSALTHTDARLRLTEDNSRRPEARPPPRSRGHTPRRRAA